MTTRPRRPHGCMTPSTRLALVLAAAIATGPAAFAQQCEYLGDVPTYATCIASQAWQALDLATANAAELACPAGYTDFGSTCIDLTCRGFGEAQDSWVTTWWDADATCTSMGARLCTLSELSYTQRGGCGFTRQYVAATAVDGTGMVYKRGSQRDADGVCASLPYTGDFYGAAFAAVDQCGESSLDLNASSNVDGFHCCI